MIVVYVLDGVMNDQTKQRIRAKIEAYIQRAEELKKIEKNGPVKKKALVDDGSGRGDVKDDNESDDPDRKRMMQKLGGNFYHDKLTISFTIIYFLL